MARSRKQEQRELLTALTAMANSYNSDVKSFDFGKGFAVGVSSAKNYVFFFKKKNGKAVEKCVPVNGILKCETRVGKIRVKTQKGSEDIIDKLELVFTLNGEDRPSDSFEFYDSDEHFQLNGELELIGKWEALIKDAMKFYPS